MTDLETLQSRLTKLLGYAEMKLEERDYHAVADAMMDARELQAQIDLLSQLHRGQTESDA